MLNLLMSPQQEKAPVGMTGVVTRLMGSGPEGGVKGLATHKWVKTVMGQNHVTASNGFAPPWLPLTGLLVFSGLMLWQMTRIANLLEEERHPQPQGV